MFLPLLLGVVGIGVLVMSKDSQASALPVGSNLKPSEFDPLFVKYAKENNLDWKMVKTIAMNESSVGKNARVIAGINNPYDIKASTSTDGKSWGIMQMTVPTARDFDPQASEVKLNDPQYSIKIACKFLASLSKQFNGKVRDIAMAYNHGAGNQKRFLELEKAGTLLPTQYAAGRAYWSKYQSNHKLLFGV